MYEQELGKLLRTHGSSLMASEVRAVLADSKRAIVDDNKVHGLVGHDAFWDLVSDNKVHVLAIFEYQAVDLYIFPAEFDKLVNHLNDRTMSETIEIRDLLKIEYEFHQPHISIPRSAAEHWLSES